MSSLAAFWGRHPAWAAALMLQGEQCGLCLPSCSSRLPPLPISAPTQVLCQGGPESIDSLWKPCLSKIQFCWLKSSTTQNEMSLNQEDHSYPMCVLLWSRGEFRGDDVDSLVPSQPCLPGCLEKRHPDPFFYHTHRGARVDRGESFKLTSNLHKF